MPERQTLDIPNVTTDVGLSPPFNSLFTIFGQFFDHGLDKITNGGNGTVFVPVKADDPLVTHGPDGIAGNGDEVACRDAHGPDPRHASRPAPGGVRNAPNTDTPFVDQSQTYTSHSSHQVFLRQYVNNSRRPARLHRQVPQHRPTVEGLATWAMIKTQAANLLGLELVDADVANIPMIDADPYGNFIPGPNGLPQYRPTTGALVEGNLADPVKAAAARCASARRSSTTSRTAPTPGTPRRPRRRTPTPTAGTSLATAVPAGSVRQRAARHPRHLW